MRKANPWGVILLLLMVCLRASAQSAPTMSGEEAALTAATKSLCSAQVAMLGESSTHGDGQTVAFKAALVKRLINQCGFDGVYFEASHYQFIHLDRMIRTGQTATGKDVLAAVGGLWEFDQEFQPLAAFLLSMAEAKTVFLGGLDDQLGQYGQDYANDGLVSDLTQLLSPPERQDCNTALHKRIYSAYSDAAPYTKSDRAQLESCLSDISSAAAADKTLIGEDKQDRLEMISAAQRWIGRDFTSGIDSIVNRDRSMFQDFLWLQNHRSKCHKVIVWAATVHIAKQADPTWGDHAGINLGSFIHKEYGASTFSLGFSALAGSYRRGSHQILEMPIAPIESVELHALPNNTVPTRYVDTAELVRQWETFQGLSSSTPMSAYGGPSFWTV